MIDDREINYKTECNRITNELSKLRLNYAELKNDRDYIHSLLDVEFEKGLKLKKEIEQLKKENEQLKKELFETRKDYILETYADNPIRRDEKLKALEKELEE